MYENVGKKIKGLAVVVAVLISLVFIGAGIALLVISEGDLGGIAVPIMLVSPIFGWLSSLLLYGFGEMIDKTCDIERILRTGTANVNVEGDSIDELPEL